MHCGGARPGFGLRAGRNGARCHRATWGIHVVPSIRHVTTIVSWAPQALAQITSVVCPADRTYENRFLLAPGGAACGCVAFCPTQRAFPVGRLWRLGVVRSAARVPIQA